ncbi:MAG: archaetidylserine decarboxylase [Myxococcota bacterium]
MKDALIVSALSVVPRNRSARAMGRLARSPASRWMTQAFVRAYGVDLSEADPPDLDAYPTLEALFTRRLRTGVRPIDDAAEALVSPVDGAVAAVGRTAGGSIEVAPGQTLALSELIDAPVEGERDVVVLYLSPKDYHRVHVPREGLVRAWRYVPGTLWPVFPAAVRRVRNLFSRNERVALRIDTDGGAMDFVLVGAFGVGRITLSFCDLVTNAGGERAACEVDPPAVLLRGAEVGTFHLGSTVVLATEPGRWRFDVAPGDRVLVGGRIGGRAAP